MEALGGKDQEIFEDDKGKLLQNIGDGTVRTVIRWPRIPGTRRFWRGDCHEKERRGDGGIGSCCVYREEHERDESGRSGLYDPVDTDGRPQRETGNSFSRRAGGDDQNSLTLG